MGKKKPELPPIDEDAWDIATYTLAAWEGLSANTVHKLSAEARAKLAVKVGVRTFHAFDDDDSIDEEWDGIFEDAVISTMRGMCARVDLGGDVEVEVNGFVGRIIEGAKTVVIAIAYEVDHGDEDDDDDNDGPDSDKGGDGGGGGTRTRDRRRGSLSVKTSLSFDIIKSRLMSGEYSARGGRVLVSSTLGLTSQQTIELRVICDGLPKGPSRRRSPSKPSRRPPQDGSVTAEAPTPVADSQPTSPPQTDALPTYRNLRDLRDGLAEQLASVEAELKAYERETIQDAFLAFCDRFAVEWKSQLEDRWDALEACAEGDLDKSWASISGDEDGDVRSVKMRFFILKILHFLHRQERVSS